MLDDPCVQGALVAVDSPRHHAVGLRVLRAHRHLLVEKPMALTVADAHELHALAETHRRVLSVDHLLLHHPAVLRAKELLADGAIGQALWVEATRFATGPTRPGQSVWWALAPHDVSLVLHLFDAVPALVSAVGGSTRLGTSGDDTVVWATLHFDDGRLAHVQVARQAAEKKRQFSMVGDRGSLIFDELSPDRMLRIQSSAQASHAEVIALPAADPLSAQCRHFVNGVSRGSDGGKRGPRAGGREGPGGGNPFHARGRRSSPRRMKRRRHWAHATAVIDRGAQVGAGTKVWHFCHVAGGARIGVGCVLGQNVYVAPTAAIGDGCRIQNNVSIYDGVILEDQVFVGPAAVFTNVRVPRAAFDRRQDIQPTRVRRGATIGANATIVCGVTIGEYAFVAAGAVVTSDVAPSTVVAGNPARRQGSICRCGETRGSAQKCRQCRCDAVQRRAGQPGEDR